MQAVGHSQIFPKKLHEQAGLRYGFEAVGAMAAQTGKRQGHKIKKGLLPFAQIEK